MQSDAEDYICDIVVMGDNGSIETNGYLQPGDFPSFKIYDASEQEYFNVFPYPENYAFESNSFFNIEQLIFQLNYSIPLAQYNNLISFYSIPPEDQSIEFVFDQLGCLNARNVFY